MTIWLVLASTAVSAEIDEIELSDLVDSDSRVVKLAGGFRFTEGPASDGEGGVYFVDTPPKALHHWSHNGKLQRYWRGDEFAIGGLSARDGQLVGCSGRAHGVFDLSEKGRAKLLVDQFEGRPLCGNNDIWLAPDGSVYFTDQYPRKGDSTQDGGYVYRLSPDRTNLQRVTEDLWRPNGIVGSADGKSLFVAVPRQKSVFRYDIDSDGMLSNRKTAADHPSDGLTLDERGNLYVTWKTVRIYSPTGRFIGDIEVPEAPSNVTFGGPDGKTLFITARTGLYSIHMRVRGG
ncbi:SMP-30/gluconolactonase/LRE family protein [Stratiformator vulcanicus]|uniref:SMP-30/gluconolactonase/LRE family protein n=1 Tax=Stratiformator vulcanicus TaxID=2527980 RepID=UPI0028772CAB|nr:SMP-30/gluconolactonase/LRE family protein [Stratiformator vulcanicus]